MKSEIKRIVITSTDNNFKTMRAAVSRPGFKCVSFPTIEIKPVSFPLPGSDYDWVVFTSKNAADIFVKKAGKYFFKRKKIAAIGAETAALLDRKGLNASFICQGSGSGCFVREFSRGFAISGKKFLLPVSLQAGKTIASRLSAKGGIVRSLGVYRTVKPRVPPRTALSFMNNGPYYFIFFSSPSSFINFMAIKGLGKLLDTTRTAAMGPATASVMEDYGVTPDIIGKAASFRSVLEEIVKYKGGGK